MMRTIQMAVACVAVLVATAGQVQADIITYSDRASWEAAAGSFSSVGFEGIAPSNSFAFQGTPATIEGVQFSSPQNVFVVGEDFTASGSQYGTGTGAVLLSFTQGITGDLGGDFTSFGVDLRGREEPSTTFNITLSTGDTFTTTINNPTDGGAGGGFFGLTTDSPFSTILIDPQSAYLVVDNFSYGPASVNAVPEPSSLALFGIGAVVGAARRRRR